MADYGKRTVKIVVIDARAKFTLLIPRRLKLIWIAIRTALSVAAAIFKRRLGLATRVDVGR